MFTSLRRRWQRYEATRRATRDRVGTPPSRRQLLRLGLAGAALLPTLGAQDRGHAAPSESPGSPPTTPFRAALPIPPTAAALRSLSPAPAADPVPGEALRDSHQYWSQFLPQRLYELHVGEFPHSFHPELPPATVWGFDGSSPGPTFHARYGEPIVVRFRNELPRHHVGFGVPQISIHLHNGHTAPASDGFPGNFYDSGLFKDHHYPNALAGFSEPSGGDPNEALGTLFYHDHRVDFTAQNVYRGLVGCYLLFDDVDSGDETDARPGALRLPSGEFDIPLLLGDRLFDADGALFFDPFNLDGILGDKLTVNGAIQPRLEVARRKYRFRVINGGPSRFYQLALSNGQPFAHIASDGNLLPAPLTVQSVRLAVAERADIVIDFSSAQLGDQIVLHNRLEQVNGRGPTGRLLSPGDALLRFDVVRDAADASQLPAQLRPLPAVPLDDAAQSRRWRFARDSGAWAINGRFFDLERVDATIPRGTAEIWTYENASGAWSHPIHAHMEELRILARNGASPPPVELARKDVVWLGPNEQVRTFRRFRDFTGRYPLHCHNVIHEDHAMMAMFEVVP